MNRNQIPTHANDSKTSSWLALTAVLAILVVAYSPLIDADFIWDDDAYVIDNKTLRTPLGLFEIWFVPSSLPQYYPLVHTTFWIEYQLWGLRPLGYHIVNLVLHAVSVLLVWRLLLRLHVPGALLAAAVFALHPVMTESVAWVTERKNVLSLPLALASTLCYLRFDDPDRPQIKGPWRYYVYSLLFFAAALLAKTVVCSLPAVLLVVFWWRQATVPWKRIPYLLPFFSLGLASGLATVWLEKHHVGARGEDWALSSIERLLVAGRVVWFYAAKLAWPHPLIFFYPRWRLDPTQAWQWLYPAAAIAVLAALWFSRNAIGRGAFAGVVIFIGVLFPALGFFDVYPFRYSFVADHFQYHASIALISLAAAAAVTSVRRLGPYAYHAGRFAAFLLLCLLAGLTFRQTRAYQSLETIYRDTLAKNPSAWHVYGNLANHLASVGRYDDAIDVARDGVRTNPDVPDVHNSLGGVLLISARRGRLRPALLREAIDEFHRTLQLRPDYTETFYNLALALTLAERHREAVSYYAKALEVNPRDVESMIGLGQTLLVLGDGVSARQWFQSALTRQPNLARARHGVGLVDAQQGRLDDAAREFQSAIASDPALTDVHFDLANVLMKQRKYPRAREHYLEVIRVQPWNVRARNNLGIALMNLGETQLAIEQFAEATRLAPDYEEARSNLNRARQPLDQNSNP